MGHSCLKMNFRSVLVKELALTEAHQGIEIVIYSDVLDILKKRNI